MLSHHVPTCGICSGALYDLERVLWVLAVTGGGVRVGRVEAGMWHVESLVLLNIWFQDVRQWYMLCILGEFQALPINLRFPLTVKFWEKQHWGGMNREHKQGTQKESTLRTCHFQVLALPSSHATQRSTGEEEKVVTHRLLEAYLLTGEIKRR